MTAQATQPETLSAFGDRTSPPTKTDLRHTLGPAASPWANLIDHIEAVGQWHFAGTKYGWSLRLRKGDRVILYLIPQSGRFLVGIVLGDKAVAAAKSARLPARVLDTIAEARRYAEGTGIRLPVSKASDLPSIKKLAALKMAS